MSVSVSVFPTVAVFAIVPLSTLVISALNVIFSWSFAGTVWFSHVNVEPVVVRSTNFSPFGNTSVTVTVASVLLPLYTVIVYSIMSPTFAPIFTLSIGTYLPVSGSSLVTTLVFLSVILSSFVIVYPFTISPVVVDVYPPTGTSTTVYTIPFLFSSYFGKFSNVASHSLLSFSVNSFPSTSLSPANSFTVIDSGWMLCASVSGHTFETETSTSGFTSTVLSLYSSLTGVSGSSGFSGSSGSVTSVSGVAVTSTLLSINVCVVTSTSVSITV